MIEYITYNDSSTEIKISYGFPGSQIPAGGLYGGPDGVYLYSYGNLPLVIAEAKPFAELPANPIVGAVAIITDSDTDILGEEIHDGGDKTVKAWFNANGVWTVTGR